MILTKSEQALFRTMLQMLPEDHQAKVFKALGRAMIVLSASVADADDFPAGDSLLIEFLVQTHNYPYWNESSWDMRFFDDHDIVNDFPDLRGAIQAAISKTGWSWTPPPPVLAKP